MDYEARVRQTQIQVAILLFAFGNAVVLLTILAFIVGPVLSAEAAAEKGDTLRWLALLLPLPSVPLGGQIYVRQSKRMAAAAGWEARIPALRTRAVLVASMFEAPALFSAVTILLFGFSWHVILGPALFVVVLAALAPTRSRVVAAIGTADGSTPDKYS